MDTREWEKLLGHKKSCTERKKKFCTAYAAKQRGEKAQDAVDQVFGVAVEAIPTADSLLVVSNEMMDSLAEYIDNIVGAAPNNDSAQGGILAELAASMDILVDTNTAQAK